MGVWTWEFMKSFVSYFPNELDGSEQDPNRASELSHQTSILHRFTEPISSCEIGRD